MAKSNKLKMRGWIFVFACAVLFFVGMIVGKFWVMLPTGMTAVQKPTKSGITTFNVPQIPLPPGWSSKENLPGNSFATAYSLDPGIKTQGTLNIDNAIDFYTFSLKNPSQIIINITDVPKALYWVLYNDQFKELASTYRKGESQGSTQISLQDPGKYYIKVWADYQQLTNYPYTIRLNILPYFE